MIPVEKRGHSNIWILAAHLISLGKLQRCLVRTVAQAGLTGRLQLEFCFSSGIGQDWQGQKVFGRCCLALQMRSQSFDFRLGLWND